jgi:very-short-patch-repair endonuclease
MVVLGSDFHLHRVEDVACKIYRGRVVGLQQEVVEGQVWLTADHRVLTKPRPRSLGGNRDWSGIPYSHLAARKRLRRQMTATERRLWSLLRSQALHLKFRRQHAIGPYITDFYCREAQIVVEVDGAAHQTSDGLEYDRERDRYLRALGLDVVRVPAREVEVDCEGVVATLLERCRLRTEGTEGARWIRAGELVPGDIVCWAEPPLGPPANGGKKSGYLVAVRLTRAESRFFSGQVYDLELEGGGSYATELCMVHACSR